MTHKWNRAKNKTAEGHTYRKKEQHRFSTDHFQIQAPLECALAKEITLRLRSISVLRVHSESKTSSK